MKYITGLHSIEEWLRRPLKNAALLISRNNSRNKELERLARSKGVPVRRASDEEITQTAGVKTHKGALLAVDSPKDSRTGPLFDGEYGTLPENALVLILDEITDPGNYGAILRSADLFGVDLVIRPKNRAVGQSPVVTQASAGADAYVVSMTAVNLSREIEQLKAAGFWIYGADMDGKPLKEIDFSGKTALVLGSEGKGLRQNVAAHCDQLVAIPTSGHIESLNVSVAAGILLYEIRRRETSR
jgi:23S rRNA (guanosine2251-2'-O)-methyltransferase